MKMSPKMSAIGFLVIFLTAKYQQSANLVLESTVRTDMYDFVIEDRLGSGGLETDFYSMEKLSLREMNYERQGHVHSVVV